MKLTTRLGTRTGINRNIEEAIRVLGGQGYLHFTPAPELKVTKGFVAFMPKPRRTLYAAVVLLRSRGSFLEMRLDSDVFTRSTIELLRDYLWVPIHIGPTLPAAEEQDEYIHPADCEDFKTILTNARL